MRYSVLILLWCCTTHATTVLLTGGAGFIGSHVAKALLQRDYRVIIVDSLNDYYDPNLKFKHLSDLKKYDPNETNLVLHPIDIRDKDALAALWRQEQPSLICHLAAAPGIAASISFPETALSINILGTLNLLELAREHGVTNFVCASSSSVYGNTAQIPFQESEPATQPCSPYAVSKRACEMLAYSYHHLYQIPCTMLRFFTVYGPCGRSDMAPFIFLHKIYTEQPIHLFGDGNLRMRDFTYIDDVVNGIIKALEHPHNFEIFNIGTGHPVSLNQLINTIECITQKKAIIIEKKTPSGDVDITHADISKAQRMLEYQPTVSIYEGMQRMFEWYIREFDKQ